MKKEIINVIKIVSLGLNELVLEIDLGFFVINSIEFRKRNKIYIHQFVVGLDYEIDFDDLDETYQKYIWQLLTIQLYN
jgi:hypothetical protein